mmetsp:Transcript_1912/g.2725  ORF Transcript_1912/g.2725 Transcript_1912/m.2725 type:complete len:241 (+) Transcript_1912:4016-4738(+)
MSTSSRICLISLSCSLCVNCDFSTVFGFTSASTFSASASFGGDGRADIGDWFSASVFAISWVSTPASSWPWFASEFPGELGGADSSSVSFSLAIAASLSAWICFNFSLKACCSPRSFTRLLPLRLCLSGNSEAEVSESFPESLFELSGSVGLGSASSICTKSSLISFSKSSSRFSPSLSQSSASSGTKSLSCSSSLSSSSICSVFRSVFCRSRSERIFSSLMVSIFGFEFVAVAMFSLSC